MAGASEVAPVRADEDVELVRAMARGDQGALAGLYDRYAALLLGLGTRILRQRREAEDLLHDVFLEAWRSAKAYDPGRGTVRTWLVMRMRSRALDRLRAAGRARVVLSEAPESPDRPDPDADHSERPDRARVRAALCALPVEQRRVLELAYFGGCSCSEIAEREGVPIGTVKSRLARGLAQLRRGLGDAESGGAR